jgi:hypothetical protein
MDVSPLKLSIGLSGKLSGSSGQGVSGKNQGILAKSETTPTVGVRIRVEDPTRPKKTGVS